MNNKLYDIVERENLYGIVELIREEDNITKKSIKVVFIPKDTKGIGIKLKELMKLNSRMNANFEVQFCELKTLDSNENIIFEASDFSIKG